MRERTLFNNSDIAYTGIVRKMGQQKTPADRGFQEAQTGFEPVNQGVADVCRQTRNAAFILALLPL